MEEFANSVYCGRSRSAHEISPWLTAAYPVGEHAVADLDGRARRSCYAVPPVWLLGNRTKDVVVPVERKERAELHPPVAQLLVRVVVEPARVRADHRDLEELELEHALDVVMQVRPSREVVPQPMARPLARGGERRARDDEGTFTRMNAEEREVSRLLFHEAPQVVRVDLDEAIRVSRVGCEGPLVKIVQAETYRKRRI